MKVFLSFLILFLICHLNGHAQNILPNGDFETNTGFPTGIGQFALATGWTNCNGSGTPDYFHMSGASQVSLPNNLIGTVYPHGGDAVMGLFIWFADFEAREYVSHALSAPMVVGNTYQISFYLTNGITMGTYGGWGADQVSIAFTTYPLIQSVNDPIGLTPQLVLPGVFYDTIWQQVSFMYTADSAYTQLTFGNFRPDVNTIALPFDSASYQLAYYFIDDIEVIDSAGAVVTPSVSFSASDSSFCGKQCIDFTDLSTNNPTSWQWFFPGADSTSSNMQNPAGICYSSYGTFDVTLIACNAAGCDTLTVTALINEFQNPPVPVLTMNADTLFSTPAYSYQWYFNSVLIPGATNQYYVFQQMGTYFVIVTDSNGCASSSSSIVLATGINESDDQSFSIYPNPSDGNLALKGVPVNAELKLYDVTGRKIYSAVASYPEINLHLNPNDGIYFLEVFSQNQFIRKKIIVNR